MPDAAGATGKATGAPASPFGKCAAITRIENSMTTQSIPYEQPQHEQAAPGKAAKQRRRWPWALGTIVAFGVGIGVGSAGQTPQNATLAAQPAPAAKTVTVSAPAPAPEVRTVTAPPVTQTVTVTDQQQAPPPPQAAAGPLTSFGDGTYKVGTDIAAGSYKTSGARDPGGECYWARLKDDSGSNIIANDLTAGSTRFTTKTGEYVQISGCDFAKG